ncbi:hypothetical protein Bpfe_021970 [Biomphalaria pfeifferi]|uniref:Uncharacterized protein n=1 Tax=Biomphalaria pfeifferi TaxID=112525 RepID=A0AAD8F1R0_BIOPF|nr:hypothetical protein Bpfe_021970 [Biomphalaria pfeifferi]
MPHRDVTIETTWRRLRGGRMGRHKTVCPVTGPVSCHLIPLLLEKSCARAPHGAPPSQAMKQVQGSKYRPMLATDTAILFKFDAILIVCD